MTEADILARTYFNRAIVLRPTPTKVNGFDDYEDVEVYSDLPCAVSFTKGSETGATDTVQYIEYVAQLFVRPEVMIEAGDKVIADVYGEEYRFVCGEGVRYASHVAVPLLRNDVA